MTNKSLYTKHKITLFPLLLTVFTEWILNFIGVFHPQCWQDYTVTGAAIWFFIALAYTTGVSDGEHLKSKDEDQ